MIAIPRLYPILDRALLERLRFPMIEAARVLLDGGVHLLQWRCKTPIGRDELTELDALASLCERARATLIVNDRADIAAMVNARGVHVGQQDLPPDTVRSLLGPRAIVGFSTHNLRQFTESAAYPIDYVALGPIFNTSNKENPDPVVGLDILARCCGETPRPVVAIGGITRENAAGVLAAGASSLAIIGDLFPEPCKSDALRQRLTEWMRLVERPAMV